MARIDFSNLAPASDDVLYNPMATAIVQNAFDNIVDEAKNIYGSLKEKSRAAMKAASEAEAAALKEERDYQDAVMAAQRYFGKNSGIRVVGDRNFMAIADEQDRENFDSWDLGTIEKYANRGYLRPAHVAAYIDWLESSRGE